MVEIIKKVFFLFNPREKKQFVLLLMTMILMAFMEVAGVVSVVPFLSVLGNPEFIQKQPYLKWAFEAFGFKNQKNFLQFLGLVSLGLVLFTSFFRAVGNHFIYSFSNMRRHELSKKLLQKYIRLDYTYFLKVNTSSLAKRILSETDAFVGQTLLPMLKLLSFGCVTLFIVATLFLSDPVMAGVLVGILFLFYIGFYQTVRKKNKAAGELSNIAHELRYKITTEILGGIKELKVLGREDVYFSAFQVPSLKHSTSYAVHQSLSELPKYFVESIGFGAIIIIALLSMSSEGSELSVILPKLGLYAFAGYRLLPAMQNVYVAKTALQFGLPSLDNIVNDLSEKDSVQYLIGSGSQISLKQSLKFENVDFFYPQAKSLTLNSVSFNIVAGSSVGIIGPTGAGKTTLIDVVLGLLTPSHGKIYIDEKELTPDLVRTWQKSIGYVPQHIFLADDTIAGNIAFGVAQNEIDFEQIQRVAKMAQIDSFIQLLPDKYFTQVGERGVRLSGGQRQRLGIARALYHNPSVLVLDEATSALDNETESEVMCAIEGMAGQKTIFIVAHRLTTVEKCDQVIRIKNGQVSIENKEPFVKAISVC